MDFDRRGRDVYKRNSPKSQIFIYEERRGNTEMTPIKRRLLYIFRGTLLRLRISWDHGKTLTLSVGYHVDKTDSKGKPKWDGSRCKANTTHGEDKVPAATINKVLEQLEDKIDKAFYVFECKEVIPETSDLKDALSPSNNAKRELGSLIKEYINEQSVLNQWSYQTKRLEKQALVNLIEVYGEKAYLESIKESDLVNLINHFTSKKCHMQKHYGDKPVIQHGLSNCTINKYMVMIHSFAVWSINKGYCSETILSNKFKRMRTAKLPVVYLTMDELRRFMSVEMTPYEKEIADAFCFCCFTGLRYSDLTNLKWGNIKESKIEIVTKKTADLIEIELNKYSRKILDSRERGGDDDRVFKKVCNENYNIVAKRIAKAAKINDPVKTVSYSGTERETKTLPKWNYITSHTPRKTFVTNALSLGISPLIVMKWTGHKTYNAMRPYIEIISTAKKDNMELFDGIGFMDDENLSD